MDPPSSETFALTEGVEPVCMSTRVAALSGSAVSFVTMLMMLLTQRMPKRQMQYAERQ